MNAAATLLIALGMLIAFADLGHSAEDISKYIGKTITDGIFTFYGQPGGRGSCGINLDCQTQTAAASGEFFSSGTWVASGSYCADGRYIYNNPICFGICVTVTYKGKSVTVPINNQCPECSTNWVDLTTSAFTAIADASVGKATGATLVYKYCNQTSVAASNCDCKSSGATTTTTTTKASGTTTTTKASGTTTTTKASGTTTTTKASGTTTTTASSSGGSVSVTVKVQKATSSNTHSFYDLVFKNSGSKPVCSVTFKINVPSGAQLTQSWNMESTSAGSSQYKLPSWLNIAAGSSYSSTGIVVSGTNPPTASIVSTGGCSGK